MLTERQLQTYDDLLRKIYTSTSILQLRSTVLHFLARLVPFDNAAFFLVNSDSLEFMEPYSLGLDAGSFIAYQDYYQSRDVYKEAVFSRGNIPPVDRSSDYMSYGSWVRNEHRSEFLLSQGIYHIACVQVLSGNNIVGEISLHRQQTTADFTDAELLLLKMLHGHLNIAFANLSKMDDNWSTAIRTFRDPAKSLALCLLDHHYHIQGITPSALDLLPQTLATGQSVYSYLKDACYALGEEHPKKKCPVRRTHRGTLPLKNGKYFYRIVMLDEEPGPAPSFLAIIETTAAISDSSQDWKLTQRETEISSLIVRGRTNRQIAEELSISENTVKTFVKRLFIKLGVHSRSEFIYEICQLNPRLPQA